MLQNVILNHIVIIPPCYCDHSLCIIEFFYNISILLGIYINTTHISLLYVILLNTDIQIIPTRREMYSMLLGTLTTNRV